MPVPRDRCAILAAALPVLFILLASAAAAQVPSGSSDPLARRAVVDARLRPQTAAIPFEEATASLAPDVAAEWEAFRASAPGPWRAYADPSTGRLVAAEGAGIPWVPGTSTGGPITP